MIDTISNIKLKTSIENHSLLDDSIFSVEKLNFPQIRKEMSIPTEDIMSIGGLKDDKQRVFINESWTRIENIHARILSVNQHSIVCECLIDREQMFFENREFDVQLFSHLTGLVEQKLIYISLKTKAGSFRLDIFDGKGLVSPSDFIIKDKFELLDNLNLKSRPFDL